MTIDQFVQTTLGGIANLSPPNDGRAGGGLACGLWDLSDQLPERWRACPGLGREHGTAAIDNFAEPKAVWMNLNV
jgi:hypothetical protein